MVWHSTSRTYQPARVQVIVSVTELTVNSRTLHTVSKSTHHFPSNSTRAAFQPAPVQVIVSVTDFTIKSWTLHTASRVAHQLLKPSINTLYLLANYIQLNSRIGMGWRITTIFHESKTHKHNKYQPQFINTQQVHVVAKRAEESRSNNMPLPMNLSALERHLAGCHCVEHLSGVQLSTQATHCPIHHYL